MSMNEPMKRYNPVADKFHFIEMVAHKDGVCFKASDIAPLMRQIREAGLKLPHAEECRRNEPDACASCGGMRELHRDMVAFAHPHEFVEPPCDCPHGDILRWTEDFK